MFGPAGYMMQLVALDMTWGKHARCRSGYLIDDGIITYRKYIRDAKVRMDQLIDFATPGPSTEEFSFFTGTRSRLSPPITEYLIPGAAAVKSI